MKIFYCLNQIKFKGGVERIITEKANIFASQGLEIYIITTNQESHKPAYKLDSRIRLIDLHINYHKITYLGYGRHYLQRIKTELLHLHRLSKLVKEEKPDIIISTSYEETTIVPLIKGRHKIIFEQHNCRHLFGSIEQTDGHIKFIEKWRKRRWFNSLKKYHAKVFLNNIELKSWGLSNSFVIPNFVYPIQESNHINKNPSKTVLHVGRLSWEKNQMLLLDAWKLVSIKYPDWNLVICGDGPEKNKLQERTSQLNINHSVSFKGNIEDIHQEYEACDIFVLTSEFESFGLSIAEAMSHSLPIVTTNAGGGIEDLIDNDYNGYIIQGQNAEQIANKLINLIKAPALREEMGRNSLTKISNYYPHNIIPRWHNLFHNLLKQ